MSFILQSWKCLWRGTILMTTMTSNWLFNRLYYCPEKPGKSLKWKKNARAGSTVIITGQPRSIKVPELLDGRAHKTWSQITGRRLFPHNWKHTYSHKIAPNTQNDQQDESSLTRPPPQRHQRNPSPALAGVFASTRKCDLRRLRRWKAQLGILASISDKQGRRDDRRFLLL